MLTNDRLIPMATSLGLAVDSLRRLGIGQAGAAFSFPMRDSVGHVQGIRLRFSDGRKSAIPRSRDGLFIPAELLSSSPIVDEQLVIAEGPTDTAALLDLGFTTIGRPSCTGALGLTVDFVRLHQVRHVIVFADRDGPGQRGADNLASTVIAYAAVRVITPPHPHKDIRAWKRAGATSIDVRALIDQTPPRRITVTSRRLERNPSRCKTPRRSS
jgi:DNA primase